MPVRYRPSRGFAFSSSHTASARSNTTSRACCRSTSFIVRTPQSPSCVGNALAPARQVVGWQGQRDSVVCLRKMGLGGQERAVADVHFEMDVNLALNVIARIDTAEFSNAIRVGAQRAPAMPIIIDRRCMVCTFDGFVHRDVLPGIKTFGIEGSTGVKQVMGSGLSSSHLAFTSFAAW